MFKNKTPLAVSVLLSITSPAVAESISNVVASQNGKVNYANVEQGAQRNRLELGQRGKKNMVYGFQQGPKNHAVIFQNGAIGKIKFSQTKNQRNEILPDSPYYLPESTNKIKRSSVKSDGYTTYTLRYRNRGFDLLSVSASAPSVSRLGRN